MIGLLISWATAAKAVPDGVSCVSIDAACGSGAAGVWRGSPAIGSAYRAGAGSRSIRASKNGKALPALDVGVASRHALWALESETCRNAPGRRDRGKSPDEEE